MGQYNWSNKFTMPIGTMVWNVTEKEHFIYLGIVDKETYHRYDERSEEVKYINPYVILYCVEKQTEVEIGLYEFIFKLDNELFNVLHDPDKDQTISR